MIYKTKSYGLNSVLDGGFHLDHMVVFIYKNTYTKRVLFDGFTSIPRVQDSPISFCSGFDVEGDWSVDDEEWLEGEVYLPTASLDAIKRAREKSLIVFDPGLHRIDYQAVANVARLRHSAVVLFKEYGNTNGRHALPTLARYCAAFIAYADFKKDSNLHIMKNRYEDSVKEIAW